MAASYSSLQKEPNWVNMVNHSIKLGELVKNQKWDGKVKSSKCKACEP